MATLFSQWRESLQRLGFAMPPQSAATPAPGPGTISPSVQVVASTWARDSHDLFDFEAHHLQTQTFSVSEPAICVRNGTEVRVLGERETLTPGNGEPLLRLVQRDGAFWVDKASSSSNSKKLWLVVRDFSGCGHRVAEGDVMKLGRFKFRVRQLAANACDGAQPELKLDDSGVVCCANNSGDTDLTTTTCRICLLEGPGEGDPLITPCHCNGTIKYVHLGCLRHWIRGRLNLSDASGGSYFYRPLACELCKAVYPTYINTGNDRLREPLVEVPHTQPPFIVLENMVRDSQQHAARGLHVISLTDKVLKLGRGHESDVRIADVSISRCHATIRFQRGHFILEDNNSKFGTLVAMKKPRMLEPSKSISIQMGRTVLSLSAQPAMGSCTIAPLQQLPGVPTSAQDERALRLSLLTRGSSRGDSGAGQAGGGTAD